MKKTAFIIAGAFLLMLGSCQNQSNNAKKTGDEQKQEVVVGNITPEKLYGSWVQPNPAKTDEVQGIMLKKDSVAQSINMATWVSTKWWLQDRNLYIIQESIGNITSSIDTNLYKIESVDENKLVLKDGDYRIEYTKQH